MKTILIPTDLNVSSLKPIQLIMDAHPTERYTVVLMYAELLSDSITELLFYSPQKSLQSLMSDSFREGLEVMQNRYLRQIQRVKVEMFNGRSLNALKLFIDAHHIDEIIIPNQYTFQLRSRAFDPIPLIKRLNLQVTEVDCVVGQDDSSIGQLGSLFLNH